MNAIWTCNACGGVMSHDPDCAFVAPEEPANDHHLLVTTIAWLMGWSWFLILLSFFVWVAE